MIKSIIFCILFFSYLASLVGYEYSPSKRTLKEFSNTHVLAAITAHYNASRLQYLREVLEGLSTLPNVDVVLITNTSEYQELTHLEQTYLQAFSRKGTRGLEIRTFSNLNHPFDLTWCHKQIISNEFLSSDKYTHFIYLEDDMKIDAKNLCYFLEFRKLLAEKGLIPSFLRVEYSKNSHEYVNTDNTVPVNITNQSRLKQKIGELTFLNAPNPYTAVYILDKDLAAEYIQSASFSMHKSALVIPWDIRERAAAGLCFENIPRGFKSRYVVPVSTKTLTAPRCCWIKHLPNNYADDPSTGFGKIPMQSLFRG